MTSELCSYASLDDDQLLQEVQRLAACERAATADLLRSLIELDARRLYLREGCSSLFTYCTQVLHLAEGAAYNRIEAARAARRFPIILEALADGALTLTSARLLAPHLMPENHGALLEAARYKTKREVELVIATLYPNPPVPTIIRKLPVVPQRVSQAVAAQALHNAALAPVGSTTVPETPWPGVNRDCQQEPVASMPAPRRVERDAIPLSSDAFKLQVTISHETHEKLRRAQDLMRHANPDGHLSIVIDRALSLLVADLERRRCAMVAAPRRPPISAESHGQPAPNRHIPAAVRRQVWRRDQGRCAFAAAGRRCGETAFLEFHHVEPYAAGGPSTTSNIELRCRAHNQYEASLFFGFGSDTVREPTAAEW